MILCRFDGARSRTLWFFFYKQEYVSHDEQNKAEWIHRPSVLQLSASVYRHFSWVIIYYLAITTYARECKDPRLLTPFVFIMYKQITYIT